MRRFYLPLMFCTVFLSVVSTPAQAEFSWDWFDYLSGPGKFGGPMFSWRLVCLAERRPPDTKVRTRTETVTSVSGDTTIANTTVTTTFPPGLRAATSRQPGPDGNATTETTDVTTRVAPPPRTPEETEAVAKAAEAAAAAAEQAKAGEVRLTSLLGFAGSACSLKATEQSRAALDISFGLFHATDPNYAGGAKIGLTILEPSFSMHVWGPLDAGFGAGVAWFSSESFESFSRFIFEPARFDIRPARWRESAHSLWEIFVFRLGWIVIPRGFEPNDFHPTAGTARRIPSEAVFYYAALLDAEPLMRAIRHQW